MPLFRAQAFIILSACLITALGCGSSGGNSVKIVSSLPRTGSAKAQTDTMVNGIRMALDEAGYKAGDLTIRFEDMDDATAIAGQATADQESANARRAASDQNVLAYIGPYNSGVAKMSMPILNEAGLLMISPANTAVGLTKPGLGEAGEPKMYRPTGKINYFRVVPADDLQGNLAADWAKDMGVKKVYVLDDKTLYGQGLAVIFEKRAKQLGMNVVGRDSIDSTSQEFRSKITEIKSTNPDLVYYGGTTQTKGGQLCKELFESGYNGKMMVPDGCMEEAFIQAAGPENAEGKVFLTFGGVLPENQVGKGKEFVDNYTKKYGRPPEAYAIYAYEAAKVVLYAINKAGKKDRAAVVAAAAEIKDFPGALGTWSFDENGDTTLKTLSGSVIKNGKFEFVKLLGADKAENKGEPAAEKSEK
jgi:branched-chain amino acid transport system substrate-binding protein